MYKELIISVVIILAIIAGNYITENYVNNAVQEMTDGLENIRKELVVEQINQEQVESHLSDLQAKWQELNDKMAYFIEHNELEKVQTNIVSLVSFAKSKDYEDAVNQLDTGIYILSHVKEKYQLELKNIF